MIKCDVERMKVNEETEKGTGGKLCLEQGCWHNCPITGITERGGHPIFSYMCHVALRKGPFVKAQVGYVANSAFQSVSPCH